MTYPITITADKISQFTRATCTTGTEQVAIAYLESEEGSVCDAVNSYQADQKAATQPKAAV